MKVGFTIEVRCPQGSVAFQSHVDCTQESIRFCRRDLAKDETWVWNVQELTPEQIAFFAMQSMGPVSILINEQETLLDGQSSNAFGVAFGRRESETFGELPFPGNLSSISVTNESGKSNRIDIIFGEVIPE